MMLTDTADNADATNVWLTSFDGFGPEVWGFVGFSLESHRARFLRESRPGVLVVIWVSSRGPQNERGKIVGIAQCSHETGAARDFMPAADFESKQRDKRTKDKWDFAVRITRAWRILPNQQLPVRQFAPKTYYASSGNDRGTFLGSQGDRIEPGEAGKLFELMVTEVNVFGQPAVAPTARGLLESLLRPSRPGPVSQEGFWVEPAEGSKHLYVLKLSGKAAIFLNDPAALGKVIVKPGFSSEPDARCAGLNGAYPNGAAFRWLIYSSTVKRGVAPLANSEAAMLAERAMQQAILANGGRSLGNEFFLLDEREINAVLDAGLEAVGQKLP